MTFQSPITGLPLREAILALFAEVWAEQSTDPAPEMTDQTVLMEVGMDSMGYAIFVSRLDEELGYDPFTSASEAFYPQTFGEFVQFYQVNLPK